MRMGHFDDCREPPVSWPLVWLALLLCGLVALPGCGGCRGGGATASAKAKKKDEKAKDVDEAEELIKKRTKKLEKPKDDFEPLAVRMLPSNDPSPSLKQPPVLVKPGHWVTVSEEAKTNNFDFAGQLSTFCEQQATNLPLEITDTTSRLWNWRPAILPKGQTKRIECIFFVPRRERLLGGVYSVRSELHSLRGGRTEAFNTTVSPSLKPYEHLIVVLAANSVSPASYSHFDRLLSVRMPQVEDRESEPLRYYFVFRPTVAKTAPLPSHSLSWTTIAYVFWDDLDPGVLTAQQQQALVDWLHWGGQLIISGPSSLDKLKGSFLADYLPGEATDTVKLDQAAFDELNERYSLARNPLIVAKQAQPPKGETLRRIIVSEERPMIGVALKQHPAAKEMDGTGGLVVERRIGGGRIVVTRFPLTDVRIKQWRNFDGFFNSALLRRPGRIFKEDNLALDFQWDDPNLAVMLLDARLGSTVRYFTRDIGWGSEEWQKESPQTEDADTVAANRRPQPPRVSGGFSTAPVYGAPGFGGNFGFGYADGKKFRPDTSRVHPAIDDFHFAGYGASWPPDKVFEKDKEMDPYGVAAWNDDAAASQAARQSLTEAAGIEIPSAAFVIKVLGLYLLVLVPLNWALFWLLGKVEWAWIAAPLIALVGAGAVIRLAQLDIGFARSRTEVAVLEVQGGYERAHLTRYTALYSSLSSSYTLTFDEATALAAPFPAGQRDDSLLSIQNYIDVSFRRDKDTSLSGVQVSSNSTGMVHSEQLLPLGTSDKSVETLRLVGDEAKGYSVSNTTDLVLRDIGVFRRGSQIGSRDAAPQIEAAYISQLDAASSAILKFSPVEFREHEQPQTDLEDSRDRRLTRRTYRPPLIWLDAWNEVPIFAPDQPTATSAPRQTDKSRIRLHRLARLASDQLRLLPGDVRLIGWTDQRLPGMQIHPEAPQNRTYTLVIAHLARGHLPPARPDQNVADDYVDPTYFEEADKLTPAEQEEAQSLPPTTAKSGKQLDP
jgi:hypothetical protein